MFSWGRTKKTLVGLDIGSSSVKAVELSRKGNEYELTNLGFEDLDADAVADGQIVDNLGVALAIGKIFSENGIHTNRVATSVSGHSVIVKKIAVEVENPEDLTDAILDEARQNLQVNLNEVKWDYQVLGQASGRNLYDVLLVAVRQEKISNYTDVLNQAGKLPVVMDIDAFALQNAFELSYDSDPQEVIALLNIGAATMNINIVRGEVSVFTRDVSVGGNQYTDALQKELDLSFADAERLKQGHEVANIRPEIRLSHLRSVSEILLLEIEKTFDFFRQTTSNESVQRIYLAGGSAKVDGLVDILKDEFHIPVEIMDPFRKVNVKASKFDVPLIQEIAPRMSVAMGLALRSFDPS